MSISVPFEKKVKIERFFQVKLSKIVVVLTELMLRKIFILIKINKYNFFLKNMFINTNKRN